MSRIVNLIYSYSSLRKRRPAVASIYTRQNNSYELQNKRFFFRKPTWTFTMFVWWNHFCREICKKFRKSRCI